MSQVLSPITPNPIDWKDALKRLAKALAKASASAAARAFVTIGYFVVTNLVLAVLFFVLVPLMGGGHGGFVLFPLALLPFVPFVILAVVLSQKQAVQRLLAGAVESQAPTLSQVGAYLMSRFFAEKAAELSQSRMAGAFDRAWQKYLATRTEAPWAVRTVLSQLTKRAPLGNLVDELAMQGVPSDQLPMRVMDRVITTVAQNKLRPSWTPTLVLAAVNAVWFPLVLWLARTYGASR